MSTINRLISVAAVILGMAFSAPAQSPVTIDADRLNYDGAKGVSVFSGNVRAVSDNMTLTADSVRVTLHDNKTVQQIFGTGNVNIRTDTITGLAGQALMDVDNQTVTLENGARVWQGDNYLEGERVIVYYNVDKILVDKGENSRVRIIFNPEDTQGSPGGTAGDEPQEGIQETDGR